MYPQPMQEDPQEPCHGKVVDLARYRRQVQWDELFEGWMLLLVVLYNLAQGIILVAVVIVGLVIPMADLLIMGLPRLLIYLVAGTLTGAFLALPALFDREVQDPLGAYLVGVVGFGSLVGALPALLLMRYLGLM